MPIQVDWFPFDSLSGKQVHDVLRLRQQVFVVEQQCAYLDADGFDARCWHGLGTQGTELKATARIVPPGLKFEGPAIGRVVSDASVRRTGVGRALMQSSVAQVRRLFPGQDVWIGAQRYLEAFYQSLGFETTGAPYDEDGIPHINMVRRF
jgi:ElaA protein